MKPADGPLLYEIRCMTVEHGKQHRKLLAQVTRADGLLSWHFEPAAWVSSSAGDRPTTYLRCARHGVGAVQPLEVQPDVSVRSKPRVVPVICT